mmetsp:Transcript_2496/g.7680  ORF Transcript_2496/g.7680 Transcript_2496/m.7680 type:complete len:317 (-) Transcript_2496:317-1267(-)
MCMCMCMSCHVHVHVSCIPVGHLARSALVPIQIPPLAQHFATRLELRQIVAARPPLHLQAVRPGVDAVGWSARNDVATLLPRPAEIVVWRELDGEARAQRRNFSGTVRLQHHANFHGSRLRVAEPPSCLTKVLRADEHHAARAVRRRRQHRLAVQNGRQSWLQTRWHALQGRRRRRADGVKLGDRVEEVLVEQSLMRLLPRRGRPEHREAVGAGRQHSASRRMIHEHAPHVVHRVARRWPLFPPQRARHLRDELGLVRAEVAGGDIDAAVASQPRSAHLPEPLAELQPAALVLARGAAWHARHQRRHARGGEVHVG